MIAALLFSFIKTKNTDLDCLKQKEIYITTNGVHLDIIVPVDNLNKEFTSQLKLIRGTKYVSFGWGDKKFYINTPDWSDLTFPTAFRAVFLKSKTAMHVTCYSDIYKSWRKVELCEEQYRIIKDYILNSFLKDENGDIMRIDIEGYGLNDSFYDANGSFSLFKTCNIWVNIGLKKAGIETSIWSPFDFGILHHLPENTENDN